MHTLREDYLTAAVEFFRPSFEKVGAPLPKVRVSTGWPSARGCAAKKKALGECWDKAASTDESFQIFISPFLQDPRHVNPGDGQGVLPTLVHEPVHAAVGIKAGHGAAFRRVATDLGLEGKMTSTYAGHKLLTEIDAAIAALGEYPHAQLNPTKSGKKKQNTRMIKCECGACGYVLRTTKKWIEIGVPNCPAGHGKMHFELPEETED